MNETTAGAAARRRNFLNLWSKAILAGSIASIVPCPAAGQDVWVGDASSLWSNPANWASGVAPIQGGSATGELLFAPKGAATLTATNDLGSFRLNQLTFSRPASTGLLTTTWQQGGQLHFSGTSAAIRLDGTGRAILASPLLLGTMDGVLALRGGLNGGLTVTGPITEETGGPPQSLLIAMEQPPGGTYSLRLSGTNTFSGGVVLQSGTLEIGGFGATLGTGPLTIKGGKLQIIAGFSNLVLLEKELNITRADSGSGVGAVISSAISGTGLTFRPQDFTIAQRLHLTALSTYDGPTIVDWAPSGLAPAGSPELRLSGSGSIRNSSAIHVRAGAMLSLHGGVGATNQIGDATTVNLRSGELFLASGVALQTEKIDALVSAGHSTITMVSGNYGVRLTASSLVREDRGTLLFRNFKLGGNTQDSTNILFTTAPSGLIGGNGTGANVSILPYAIGTPYSTLPQATSGTSFVTYDPASGIRLLNLATEYATLLEAGATANVRPASDTTNNATATVNALLLEPGRDIFGTGSITLGSGALLARGGNVIENDLTYGDVEAKIFTVGSLAIQGNVSGSNGLTKSGSNTILTLSGTNTIAGPLTINGGVIEYSRLSNLGAPTGIMMNGKDAGLTYTGSGDITLATPIEIKTGLGTISAGRFAQGPASLTVTGGISGAGGVVHSSGKDRPLYLSGTNTYTGPTVLTGGGDIVVASDSALGNGGDLILQFTALKAAASWSTSRLVRINDIAVINTNGHNLTFGGSMLGSAESFKLGDGVLGLTGASQYSGAITVREGALTLGEEGLLRTGSFSVESKGQLRLNNSTTAHSDRLLDAATVTLTGGRLHLGGNGDTSVTEKVAAIIVPALSGGSTISLEGSTLRLTQLTTDRLEIENSHLVISAGQLGAAERFVMNGAVQERAGILPSVFVASPNGGVHGFAVYNRSSDARGVVGFQAFGGYETGNVIPATPGTAGPRHFLLETVTSAEGTLTEVASLNLGGTQASLSLAPEQRLYVSTGSILVQQQMIGTIAGGTLEFGGNRGLLYAGRDSLINSTIAGQKGWMKTGPGALTFAGTAAWEGELTVAQGNLIPGANSPLSTSRFRLGLNGVLDVQMGSTTVGNLVGNGRTLLGSSTLTIGASGIGSAALGAISGTGGLSFVGGGNAEAIHTLGTSNIFTGGVQVYSGRLGSLTAGSLGTGVLLMKGGSLYTGATQTLTNRLELLADARIEGNSLLTLDAEYLDGPGGMVVQGRGGVKVTSIARYHGETRIAFGKGEHPSTAAGAITLAGATGKLERTSAVRIGPGGALILDNTVTDTGLSLGRLPFSTPLHLSSSTLRVIGNAAKLIEEMTGVISGAGYSTLDFVPAKAIRFSASDLVRERGGTFFVRGVSLQGPLDEPTPTSLSLGQRLYDDLVGGGGTGAAVSILPYAIGGLPGASTGTGLVTYDFGLRLLDPVTGYVTQIGSAAPNENVRITASETLTGPSTVNALVIAADGVTLGGPGVLTVASGTILSASGSATISAGIDFGAREGHFFTAPVLNVGGNINGSGGITKSGSGVLVLRGQNSFSGRLLINAGDVNFTSMSNLGAGTSPIQINANVTGAGLDYEGSVPLTFDRAIEVLDGYGVLRSLNNGGELNVTGTITGTGGLVIRGAPFIRLSAANSYKGATIVEGHLTIASDAALGDGGAVELRTGSLGMRLDGIWNTQRRVVVTSPSTLQLQGFDATLNGPLEGNMRLTVLGTGSLSLTAKSTFSGPLTAPALRLVGTGSIRSEDISVGSLTIDYSAALVSDRVSDTGALRSQSFNMVGNANAVTVERAGLLGIGSPGQSRPTIRITSLGGFPTILEVDTYGGVPDTEIHAQNLGAPGSNSNRLRLSRAPALSGGLLNGLLVVSQETGEPDSFAYYDAREDRYGAFGVRALLPSEYVTPAVIANLPNGGETAMDANLLAQGSITAAGASNTVNSITVAGNSVISLGDAQTLTLAKPALLTRKNSQVTFEGGTLAFTGAAVLLGEGNVTLRSRITAGGLSKYGTGHLSLRADSYGGELQILNGTASLQSGMAPASLSALEVSPSASLDLKGIGTTISSLTLGGSMALSDGALLTLSSNSGITGTLSGTGGITMRGTVAMGGASTYSGPTRIEGGSLSLRGNGSALQSSSIHLTAGGRLELDSGYMIRTAGISRIGVVPVRMSGSHFELIGSASTSTRQEVASITGSGFNRITLSNYGTFPPLKDTALVLGQLVRDDRGTFLVENITGGSSTTPKRSLVVNDQLANQLVGTGASPFTRPILPHAVHVTTGGFGGLVPSLLTYDAAAGLRPLDLTTEYSSALTTGQNVRLTTSIANTTNASVNALVLHEASITGGGTLSIASGSIASRGNQSIGNAVAFGTREGALFVAEDTLRITGNISGTAGLTFTGLNLGSNAIRSAMLSGMNSFTGPITVNSGVLGFVGPASFGPGNEEIALHEGTLAYYPPSGAPGTAGVLNRPIRLSGSVGTLESQASAFEMHGLISGSGSLRLKGDLRLAGVNTYSGETLIDARVRFGSDAVFGAGQVVRVTTGDDANLALEGDWKTNRDLQISGTLRLDTAGHHAELRGRLSGGTGLFAKAGVGTALVADSSTFTGAMHAEAGTLQLAGVLGVSSAIRVESPATLSGNFATARDLELRGTLQPGDAGIGSVRLGNLDFYHESTLTLEIASASDFDSVTTTGGVTLHSRVNLELSVLGRIQSNVDSFILVANGGSTPTQFNSGGRLHVDGAAIDEGGLFNVGTQEFRLSYAGGDGNDLAVYAVPEPTTAALMGSALALVGLRRRGKRRT